ncbi:GDSL family lipase [Prosthecobacter sp. SYSU 5D2]|uniref:GDSL family lipase n=1 Tax=Prosthecobacter sp. SYSU 5D2 TaxID=3134134 RepID=UPI0031FE4C98
MTSAPHENHPLLRRFQHLGLRPRQHHRPFPLRHPHDVRWTGVLSRLLGPAYRIIEEDQNGRTAVRDDPLNIARKGKYYLPACLESHKPIDLVILMLGTNDLKTLFNLPPSDIAAGAGVLARMILTSESGPTTARRSSSSSARPLLATSPTSPKPPPASTTAPPAAPSYPVITRPSPPPPPLLTPSPLDAVHLDASQHQTLAHSLATKVKELL